MNLNDIHSPADIKKLKVSALPEPCQQLRATLLQKLSHHGGHCGPNLGFLEATVALHYVFDAPHDQIVFDVSHQTYVHKMLTGRMEAFTDPAKYDSVTGYTCPAESPYDLFTVGHTSTAVSMAEGLARARDLSGGTQRVVAVVGDGALGGGEALEGLNSAATLRSNFIVVVNDNDMSIAENHGGIYAGLAHLRETAGQSSCNLFKAMGFDYVYVPYGNDVAALVEAFRSVSGSERPVVVHIRTQKGNGYGPAEAHREDFHFTAPFDLPSGLPLSISEAEDYGSIFADFMLSRMERDPHTVVLTAGTPGAIGFGPEERARAGRQFVDVGIAEQDAVSVGAGLAKGGMRPCFGVVSSFLQRTYDQLSQDVAINGQPLVLSVFYASARAMTDATHLGWFDVPLVANIPGWVVLAPTCAEEYLAMMEWAMTQTQHPVMVRVPGGGVTHSTRKFPHSYSELNRSEVVRSGSGLALIAAGPMLPTALNVADRLAPSGISPTVINARFLSGLDTRLLTSLLTHHSRVITLEDSCLAGGYGEKVAAFYGPTAMKVHTLGLPKEFRDRYSPSELLAECHLTPDTLVPLVLNSF